MDKTEFQKYLATKQKLTKEFKNIDELEEKYNKVMKSKEKLNEYQKAYHHNMMENDPEYVEKRKTYNKKSYERYKEKHKKQDDNSRTQHNNMQNSVIQDNKQVDNPVEKQDSQSRTQHNNMQDLENPARKQPITLDNYFRISMLGI